jgi:hypothetical protein
MSGHLTTLAGNTASWEVAVFCCLILPSLFQSRKEKFMSMYPIKDLLSLWSQGKLLAEQAIGQIIQHALSLSNRLAQVEKRLQALEQPPNPKV